MAVPKLAAWTPGQRFLPSGAELSQHLAGSYGYPEQDTWDLLRVSQYIAVESGPAALYEDLRQVFDADFPPTPVHDFFARLPALLRERGGGKSHLLIVTTNYDDLMEQSLTAAGEPFDVVTYVADGRDSGKFRHYPPGGPTVLIERPNEYRDVSLDQRHVVLKIHGAVDRASRRRRQLRDHRGPLHRLPDPHGPDEPDPRHAGGGPAESALPVPGLQPAGLEPAGDSASHLGRQKLKRNSWSVQLKPQAIESNFWQRRNVEILDVSAADYIAELQRRVEALPVAGGAP